MTVTATLSIDVLEGGTVGVTAAFTDEDGDAATPKTLTYTLLNAKEEVINSKEDETLTPATSVTVPLSGDDLPAGKIFFVVNGTYDSDLGSDLPLKGYADFTVKQMPGS